MSILIKDMKMPSKCQYCGLLRYYPENGNVWCNASNKLMMEQAWFEKIDIERPRWCPLIELPEKHGRLIDENEVRIVMNWLLTQPQRPTWNDTYHAIQEMNAVIEAEGDDE